MSNKKKVSSPSLEESATWQVKSHIPYQKQELEELVVELQSQLEAASRKPRF